MFNFFLGMMFMYVALPILETITSAICTAIEVYRAKCNVKITEYNKLIQQINSDKEAPVARSPIGFKYEEEEDESNEDEIL